MFSGRHYLRGFYAGVVGGEICGICYIDNIFHNNFVTNTKWLGTMAIIITCKKKSNSNNMFIVKLTIIFYLKFFVKILWKC